MTFRLAPPLVVKACQHPSKLVNRQGRRMMELEDYVDLVAGTGWAICPEVSEFLACGTLEVADQAEWLAGPSSFPAGGKNSAFSTTRLVRRNATRAVVAPWGRETGEAYRMPIAKGEIAVTGRVVALDVECGPGPGLTAQEGGNEHAERAHSVS